MQQPEALRDFEMEVVSETSVGTNQLVYMPQTSSHIAIATGIIKKHLMDMKEHTDTEDGESVIASNGCDIDHENLRELNINASNPLTGNSPRSQTSRILLVVPSKKDVTVTTCEVKKYMPFHKISEHGIHSSQKMGLLRAVQVCNFPADFLNHEKRIHKI